MLGFKRDEDGNEFFKSTIELPEGYKAVRCTSGVEFYKLRGRSVKIEKENLVPRFGLHYAIYAPPISMHALSDRYYPREFREMTGYEEYVKSLKGYIKDRNLWLLFSPTEIEETTDALTRLYKAYHKKEGKLDYKKQYIPLLETALYLEMYIKKNKEDVGYKTKIAQLDTRIKYLYSL